jgi:hypothetical protein
MPVLTLFGGFVGVVILIAVSSIFNGYALSVMWGWFMVPVFQLPQLTVAPAIGIALVVGYLTKQYDDNSSDDKDKSFGYVLFKSTVIAFVRPLFALLFGYIVHLFM